MSTKKAKKAKSVFGVLAVILLLLLIAVTVTANVIFSGDSVPMVGGYYLYMNESAEMEPDIPENSLIFAKQAPVKASMANTTSIAQGNKVLCYLPDGNLAPRQIYDLTMDANGDTVYYPSTMTGEPDSLSIPRSNIIALCSWASKELYSFVKFATSVPGLMAFLVVPCIILIALLLVKIAKSGKEEIDEDDFFFDEDVEPIVKKPVKAKKTPLFDPEATPADDETLEKKKSSISEHFSAKPVNENSPYQKAVQERTMKFKAPQQEDVERAQQEAEARKKAKKAAPAPAGTQVFTPSEVEEAAQKPAPKPIRRVQRVEDTPAPAPKRPVRPVEDPVTPPAPKAAQKPAMDPPPAPAPKPAAASEPAPAPAPKTEDRFSSPNIDDILGSSYHAASSKTSGKSRSDIASSGSIDDLIAVLEKEQKKL